MKKRNLLLILAAWISVIGGTIGALYIHPLIGLVGCVIGYPLLVFISVAFSIEKE